MSMLSAPLLGVIAILICSAHPTSSREAVLTSFPDLASLWGPVPAALFSFISWLLRFIYFVAFFPYSLAYLSPNFGKVEKGEGLWGDFPVKVEESLSHFHLSARD